MWDSDTERITNRASLADREQGTGRRRRRDARTAEEEPHRGGHFITLCDLNSNQLMATAACRCKRPRKKARKEKRYEKKGKDVGVTKGSEGFQRHSDPL